MKKTTGSMLLAASVLFLFTKAEGAEIYFPIGGVKYRMAGAHTILSPGVVGEKLASGINTFSMYTTPDLGSNQLFSLATTYTITNSTMSDLAIALNAEVGEKQIQAALGLAKGQKFSGVFQIYSIANEGRRGVIEELNKPENRETIIHLQKLESPRLVSTVVKVVQFDRSTVSTNSVSVSVPSNIVPNIPVSAGITNLSQSMLQDSFSTGTMIAYEFDRIYWTTNGSGQIIVGHLRPDRPKIDVGSLPAGMKTHPKDLLPKK